MGEDNYDIFIKSDIGDIVGIEGIVMRTNTNQLTVKCQVYTHLSKAIRPLPEKFHGLQDIEETRRRRYVDLIVNEESKKSLLCARKSFVPFSISLINWVCRSGNTCFTTHFGRCGRQTVYYASQCA